MRRSRSRTVSLTWHLDDAEEVASLFEGEARRLNDAGWAEDALEIRRQMRLYEEEE